MYSLTKKYISGEFSGEAKIEGKTIIVVITFEEDRRKLPILGILL